MLCGISLTAVASSACSALTHYARTAPRCWAPAQVRQCQALVTRVGGGGDPLTDQEQEKVSKMDGW